MRRPARTRLVATLVAAVTAALVSLPSTASADSAPADPAAASTPATVSADALPTVQVDGVVWSQVVVGSKVYAAGSFTSARPAGTQRGTRETPRANLLSYDLRTGALDTAFAPTTNGQVLSITRSPDGSRLYIGGDFTSVNGVTRSRIAALDLGGNLIGSFVPLAGTTVRSVVATADTVYLGGDFSKVFNGSTAFARTYAAAVSAADGTVLPWNPSANAPVLAMTLTPDRSRMVLGGRFTTLAGQAAYGMGAVDATTGAVGAWAANAVLRDAGQKSAITSLNADEDSVYGTGYSFDQGGNFEGMFRADPTTGQVVAMEDCHGDTYASASRKGVVYVASHSHSCSNVGGFPETNPRSWRHGLAFSKARTGTIRANTQSGYASFLGQPASSLQTFFPDFGIGTYTGQSQAAWSVVDAGDYLLYAGEFPTVNGSIQQGLVRFTDAASAPNKMGPAPFGQAVTLGSPAAGVVQAQWSTTSDPDNATLTYRLYRGDVLVKTVAATSTFWQPQVLTALDVDLPLGQRLSYRVTATDPFGNVVSSDTAAVTVASTGGDGTIDGYSVGVLDSRPDAYWRVGERSGTTAGDLSGNGRTGTFQGRYSLGATGAVSGSTSTAVTLSAAQLFTAAGSVAATTAVASPGDTTQEMWFRTTSRAAGRLFGLGNQRSSVSSVVDRVVTMTSTGRVAFAVETAGTRREVVSPAAYNDGAWHHLVATVGAGGSALFVDGAKVASDASATTGRAFTGYWRVGADATASGQRSATAFVGSVDEVATYSRVLSAAEIGAHRARGIGQVPNRAPAAAFTSSTDGLTASFDASTSTDSDGQVVKQAWDFGDGTTGTGATTSHAYPRTGTYQVVLTVTDDDGDVSSTTRSVVVNSPPQAAFTVSTQDLRASFDASGSTDDGSVTDQQWSFGDGTTGSGRTVDHAYAAAGTYDVRLTVTDDLGATSSTTRSVTVTAPAAPRRLATDGFGRSVVDGLGTADLGGQWTVAGGRTNFSVDGRAALLRTAAGASLRAGLSTTAVDSDTTVDVAVDARPVGGGISLGVVGRGTTTDGYRAHVGVNAAGSATAYVSSMTGGVATTLRSVALPSLTLTPGTVIHLRTQVSGTAPTTIRFKVWAGDASEPSSWTLEATDATASLQQAGGVGLWSYLNPAATNGPITTTWDDLSSVAP